MTIALPRSIAKDDREFFRLRWSDSWINCGFSRFCAKWNLSGPQPVLASQLRRARAHRPISHDDALHKRLGFEADSIVNRRLLAPRGVLVENLLIAGRELRGQQVGKSFRFKAAQPQPRRA